MELVIVLAVITILVGIALPSLAAYSRHAKELEMADHQELVQKAVNQYYAYEGHYPVLDGVDPDHPVSLNYGQADDLRGKLKSVVSASIDIKTYTYEYNEKTGSVTLSLN